jgi:hypothetical protein
MRLTILAGLITGSALAMQVTVIAHARPKPVVPNSAIRIRVVAPWYIASDAHSASANPLHTLRTEKES